MDRQAEIKTIINNETFINEVEDMIKECFSEIENSNPEDVDIRERAYNRVSAINNMMTRLQSVVDSDKIKDKSWTIL